MPLYDLIRPLKIESPQAGGTQFDMGPTEANPLQDALATPGVYVQDNTASAVDRSVLVDRSGPSLRLTDQKTSRLLTELVTTVPGQPAAHNALLDVIHFLVDGPGDGWASGAVAADTYTGPLRTSSVWYTDNTQTKRIVGYAWTYSGPLVLTQKITLYATDGVTVVRTVTDTFSYSGPLRTQRARVWGNT